MTLEESVKFVCKSIEYMRGGEIFIPKLPAIKIYDLVKSLDKKIKINIVVKTREKYTNHFFLGMNVQI